MLPRLHWHCGLLSRQNVQTIHTTWKPPFTVALYDARSGLPGQGGQGQVDPVDPEVGAGRVVPCPAVLHQTAPSAGPEGPQADAADAPWREVVGGGGVVGCQWLKVE